MRTACRAGGAEVAGAGTLCTSGLACAGNVVTSLISCPVTSGPKGKTRVGGLVMGEVWRGRWGARTRVVVVCVGVDVCVAGCLAVVEVWFADVVVAEVVSLFPPVVD